MISIIVPFFNESENLPLLHEKLTAEMDKIKRPYEIVLINDGSTDNSQEVASKLEKEDSHVRIVKHRKRFGKGQALATGVKSAHGDILFFMDADLQNDPADMPKFLTKIDEGYELVNGVRDQRVNDNFLIRSYSMLANWFVRSALRSPFTDINAGYKALKKEIIEEVPLYGNNFRFMPLAGYYKGYKVTEVKIHNKPRIHGKSKFGSMKIFVGFLDTMTAYFLYQFSERPLHFFGAVGGLSLGLGFIIALYLSFERIVFGILLYRRPLLLLAILLIIVGFQIVMTGFLGELIVYMHKRAQQAKG